MLFRHIWPIIDAMRTSLLILLFLAPAAHATTLSRLYDFQSGTKIQSDQVNAEFDNIVNAINGTLDGTSNIAQGAIATGNIATGAVTIAKLAALGQQVSSPPPVASSNTNTLALVPNLSANITVDHRPVWVGLQPSGSGPGRVSYGGGGGGSTSNSALITFQRDSATANQSAIGARDTTSSTNKMFLSLPCSAFWFMDVPTAGPHNYTAAFQTATSDSGIVTVENCKLVVFEL